MFDRCTHTDGGIDSGEQTGRRSFLRAAGGAGAALVGTTGLTGTAAAGGFGGDNGDYPIPDDYPMITTRGHFDGGGDLTTGRTRTDYGGAGDWEKYASMAPGDGEILVAVHGFNIQEPGGRDVANTTRLALRDNGYDDLVVGYTWDSDEGGGFDFGWGEANEIARKNGPKLAQWISDHNDGGGPPIRLIGHSLGVRVVSEALADLQRRGRSDTVRSATLLGGAVDDQAVETDEAYGDAFEYAAGSVTNCYKTDDSVLGWAYSTIEFDTAVGEKGIQNGDDAPDVYADVEVTDQVADHNSYYEPGEGCVGTVVENF